MIKLHEELELILNEKGRGLTTKELASEVNKRDRYKKRNGTAMTDYQVYGRVNKYPSIFKLEGIKVTLVSREKEKNQNEI